MSEPRWHDSDPRPPSGSVPGPGFRPGRNVPEPAPGGRRFLDDGKPAAWEGPGWYRQDSELPPAGLTDPFSAVPTAGSRRADSADRRGDSADRRGDSADRRGGRPERRGGPADRRGEPAARRGELPQRRGGPADR